LKRCHPLPYNVAMLFYTGKKTIRQIILKIQLGKILFAYIICACFIMLASCHFFGPADNTGLNNISSLKDVTGLEGKWRLSKDSYTLLTQKGYNIDSIYMQLNKDSTFEAVNLPDCIPDEFGKPKKGALINAQGKWSIAKPGKSLALEMSFDKGLLFNKPTYITFNLYKITATGKLMIGCFLGDPDSAEMLAFER